MGGQYSKCLGRGMGLLESSGELWIVKGRSRARICGSGS